MASIVERLRELRGEANADPDEVLRLALQIGLDSGLSAYGDESWSIYEQCFYAAIITDRFGMTDRAVAMQGMILEAQGNHKEAQALYEDTLRISANNPRRIALSRSLGRHQEAIDQLSDFLDTYYSDVEAWAELADIYWCINELQKAAFCLSELILLQPFSHEVHAKLGECNYALARIDPSKKSCLSLALKSFCRSVELCDDYVRGFVGIRMTLNAINNLSESDRRRTLPDLSKDDLEKLGATTDKVLDSLIDSSKQPSELVDLIQKSIKST